MFTDVPRDHWSKRLIQIVILSNWHNPKPGSWEMTVDCHKSIQVIILIASVVLVARTTYDFRYMHIAIDLVGESFSMPTRKWGQNQWIHNKQQQYSFTVLPQGYGNYPLSQWNLGQLDIPQNITLINSTSYTTVIERMNKRWPSHTFYKTHALRRTE